MEINNTAHANEIVPLFRQFMSITGWEPWKNRFDKLREQIRANPLIEDLFHERYMLELEIERLQKNIRVGRIPRLSTEYQEYAPLAFIATIARLHSKLNGEGQRRLSGMLRSGLNDEYGLTSLQHEIEAAVHLFSRGFDVTFSDLEGVSQFDFLATRNGIELEVECKTFSADVGRQIHRRRLYQLGGSIYSAMLSCAKKHRELQFIRVIIPERLNGSDAQISALREYITASLSDRSARFDPKICFVEYTSYALEDMPFDIEHSKDLNRESAKAYIEAKTGYQVAHALLVYGKKNGLVAIAIESKKKDQVIDGLISRLKKLVKKQLTGSRPALIWLKFLDLKENELLELAKRDRAGNPSALQLATDMLLNREDWRCVHSVAYSTPGHVTVTNLTDDKSSLKELAGGGICYFFTNPNHELVQRNDLKIFF